MKKRLAIITTHPIQYNAPFFHLLKKRGHIDFKVFYTWGTDGIKEKFDPGFGKKIKWDIDLIHGYEYEFLENVAIDKGSHHYIGIDNPHILDKIESYSPDAILVYGWPLKSHLKAMRFFKKKVPVLFRGDSVLKTSDDFLRKLAKKFYISWVYRHVDFAFYTGKKNKEYFLNHGIKEENLIYAPHAVDNDFFMEQLSLYPENRSKLRMNLNIPSDKIVFLYAGKLDQNKNIYFLLESFSALNAGNIHMVIAGDGKEKNKLVDTFGDRNNIHFLPFQNQSSMPFLYGMADVFVLPSLNETWGLSINEAMACSCTVLVSSTVGAAPDIVKDGYNGFVFNSNDKNDLIDKMIRLTDKNLVRKMCSNSKTMINRWNFELFCEVLEKSIVS